MSDQEEANSPRGSSGLDGNAAAGLLRQIFASDITTAEIRCAGCESTQPVAMLRLYGLPMGIILRCPRCQCTLIRAVAHQERCWLDLRGASMLSLTLE